MSRSNIEKPIFRTFQTPDGLIASEKGNFVKNLRSLVDNNLVNEEVTGPLPPFQGNLQDTPEMLRHHFVKDTGTHFWRYWNPSTKKLTEVRMSDDERDRVEITVLEITGLPPLTIGPGQHGLIMEGETLFSFVPLPAEGVQEVMNELKGEEDSMLSYLKTRKPTSAAA